MNTDKVPTYGPAIAELKKEGKLPRDMVHRQVKYLNTVIEADHGKLKRLIKPVRGFKSMKTAYATIKGFPAALFQYGGGIMGEVRLIKRQFNVHTAQIKTNWTLLWPARLFATEPVDQPWRIMSIGRYQWAYRS